jgi:SNF2 family DNA or RNA helicase
MNILDNDFKNKIKDKEQKKEKLKNKIENLIEIITSKKNGKFLVFSAYDETFGDGIIKEFTKHKIIYSTILGSVSHINNVINDFSSGKINVVMMNAKHYGSGLNLQMATDVILYHEMPKELETQVIGRAQRLGRDGSLVVHYLLHENEKCNSNNDLTYENQDFIDQNNINEDNIDDENII